MRSLKLPLVSIVIPHWNAGSKTQACLGQIRRWDYPVQRLDILVVDNGSTDGSSTKLLDCVVNFRKNGLPIRYHRFDSHPGLTASLTRSMALLRAETKYLMRLDNDVELNDDALSAMVALMETKQEAGVVGPRLVYSSAPEKLNGGAVWINPWGGRNRIGDPIRPTECDTLLGAVLLFRLSALRELGRWFAPELFLFAEEPEICWQLRRRGFSTLFQPAALGQHDTAQSTGKHSDLSTYLNFRNHTLVYSAMFPPLITVARNLNLFPRILLRCLRQNSFIPLQGFFDGLLERPLNEAWWQDMISGQSFRRP